MAHKILARIWYAVNPMARKIAEMDERLTRVENRVLKDAVKNMADNI